MASGWNHSARNRKLLSGELDPYGPGEMLEIMRHEGFKISAKRARLAKELWQMEDKVIQRNYARRYKMNDQLPPCHDCPAEIFAYCQSADRECKGFQTWTIEGTRRLTMIQEEAGELRKVRSQKGNAQRKARRAMKAKEAAG